MFKRNRISLYNSGSISRIILILAVIVLLIIVAIFLFSQFRSSKKSATETNTTEQTIPPPPKPVYETQINEIKFYLQSSTDLGNILKSDVPYQNDLNTTEKFIEVVIGAQNKGKTTINQFSWDVGNIIDDQGRIFNSINNQAYYFLPKPNPCGTVLKPEFEPTSCTKLYEVAKISTGLKIEVKVGENKSLLDLKLRP